MRDEENTEMHLMIMKTAADASTMARSLFDANDGEDHEVSGEDLQRVYSAYVFGAACLAQALGMDKEDFQRSVGLMWPVADRLWQHLFVEGD